MTYHPDHEDDHHVALAATHNTTRVTTDIGIVTVMQSQLTTSLAPVMDI
jgi:LmbE family N-acetylglucosaminyl deacetylase